MTKMLAVAAVLAVTRSVFAQDAELAGPVKNVKSQVTLDFKLDAGSHTRKIENENGHKHHLHTDIVAC